MSTLVNRFTETVKNICLGKNIYGGVLNHGGLPPSCASLPDLARIRLSGLSHGRLQHSRLPSFLMHRPTRSNADPARRALPRRRHGLHHGVLPPSLHDDRLPSSLVRQSARSGVDPAWKALARRQVRAPPWRAPSIPLPWWQAPPWRRAPPPDLRGHMAGKGRSGGG